ncbi:MULTISPECIES: glutamine--fructose-6-phosphate transaminase (isomerizing) [unclassified Oceanobacter]|jgi:glucosamine--fructose-6-phosphate aminotransferase (isomerizing)|uniref:glutamine--fructose-6-phosphate transaminase (isomerizing) n=1 Tax=unclassified Oceanobacter TaxID=2620260 RepID=UPI0027326D1D|nr:MULTISPECIES: glutamine--fructose-6-phosphate transaminase (isomerizing) [unclassified Oceanobacter]MDP2504468.1 glutamine--fructose-6-phosphate transaminase (isomerizing) [Oceanobacter sp. 3_MG-2023]MDP2547078.1 glutamine--fructose-6-phosphate transaminase (isomerizing) [Oceanobacter sp. 4_MG-2023]
MCGIVGAVAQRDVVEILLEGLRRLEYRGYDSAGVAILDATQPAPALTRVRRLGKVQELANAIAATGLPGGLGIAHTRWATHGEPSEANAHPHISGDIAVVHNGIIENHASLRRELQADGYHFESQTDTEVIAHLIARAVTSGESLLAAVKQVRQRLEGAYGMVAVNRATPDRMVVARSGSPLVIGFGIGEHFVASDQLALLPVTRKFAFLEEGDVAEITRQSVQIFNIDNEAVERETRETSVEHDAGDKGEYRHYMLKEIHEQPQAIANTLEGRLHNGQLNLEALGDLSGIDNVQIIACGTSYHAGVTARYWIEALAGLSCNVEIASEFRYRQPVVRPNTLLVTISQSGETADTLAALKLAKQLGFRKTLSICNVPGSSLVRESDMALMTRAGAEIGVASTKAFTTQLTALLLLTAGLAQQHPDADAIQQRIATALAQLPGLIQQALKMNDQIEQLAERFADKHNALFLGRGDQYPIAMEGALKLKEISYIHAEAYAAGELKHGPLALIDAEMPIVVVAPHNDLVEKLKSNIEEVRARGGELYVFAGQATEITPADNMIVLSMPACDDLIAPIVYTLPLQLLSYHVAIIKGTDVDQPRNLAKSVTVE